MVLAAIIMLVLSVALSWLPFLGPLAAGIAGGYYAGTIGRALLAAVAPLILLGIFVWVLGAALDHAIAGFFVGVGVTLLLVIHEAGLFIGALIGGALGYTRARPAGRAV